VATWSGGGGDDNWTTPANWAGGVAPAPGDALVFAGGVRLTPINDFPGGTAFTTITFDPTAGAFSITGARIELTGGIANDAAAAQAIGCDLSGVFSVAGDGGAVTLTGAIGVSAHVTKSGSHTLTIGGTTDNVGLGLTANAGMVILAKTSSAGVHAIGGETVAINGATVKLGGTGGDQLYDDAVILVNSGTFDTDGRSEAFNTLSGAGTIDNTGGGASVLTIGATGGGSSISGAIQDSSGTLAIVKAGAGTMVLSGTNTYSGGTTITGGTLSYPTDAALSGTGAIILNGGTLLHTGVSSLPNALSVTASSTIRSDDGDDLTLTGANLTATGGTLLSLVNTAGAGTHSLVFTNSGFTYAGDIALDGNSRLWLTNTSGTQTFSGVISGTGDGAGVDGAVKRGAAGGTTVLSGASTYTGVTVVESGTLSVTGSTAAGSAVTVAAGGALTGTGTVGGTVNVASGGSIAPGVSTNLTASFVAGSLQAVSEDDWRSTRTIAGTRIDQLITYPANAFGTEAERTAYGIWGDATDWNNFAVQWDGFLQVAVGGTILSTRSDDGSRVWLDLNGNGVVDGGEWGSNGWGFGQGSTTRAVHAGLAAGTYRMRVQYDEAGGGNLMHLLWNDPAHSAGTVDGLAVVPADLLSAGSTIATLTTGAVTFAGGAALSVELDGTLPSADLLATASSVVCAGTLAIARADHPAIGKVYTIISAGSVSGAFTGLPHGALIGGMGRSFQIAYTATTVTLTDVAHPTTRTWDGGGTDDNWTTAANWDSDIVPVAGDDLHFAGSTRLTPVNDFPPGTTFASITFDSGAGAFVLGPTGVADGAISREVWTGVGGLTVAEIPVLNTPNISDTLTSLEGPTNWNHNYGTRIRGYVIAPTTGSYTFWIASDDHSELWLSTDTLAANKVLIASVGAFTNARQWDAAPSQKSAPIALVANQRYYIEVLHKQNTGDDHLAVGWAKPGESTAEPSEVVPGSRLSQYLAGIVLTGGITNLSATTQTLDLGLYVPVTCTVAATSGAITIQGVVSGPGGLTKQGAATLMMLGANAYAGGTAVLAGTLRLGTTLFSGFGTDGTGWTLNGGPSVAGDVLTITTNANGQARSAFRNAPVPVSGFTATFRYQAGGDRIADGVTFTLQNDGRGAGAVGPGGGSLGYATISPSLALALNIWSGNTVGTRIVTNGVVGPPYDPPAPVDLASGNPIRVTLAYDGATTLVRTLQDLTTGDRFSATSTISSLTTTLGGTTALLGFTGGTGGAPAEQRISALAFDLGGSNRLPIGTALTIASGATLDLGGGGQRVASLADSGGGGGIVTNGGAGEAALRVEGSGSTSFSGVFSDGPSGITSLTKEGSGTLTLSGTSTATGTITVGGGTLLVTGATAAGATVTVAGGATLGGNGTVAGAVTLQAGGILAPGTGGTTIATLATGAVTADAASIISVDLDGSGPSADRCSSSGIFACAGTLTVASLANAAAGRAYTIASGSAISGTFTGLVSGATFTQVGRTFQIIYGSTAVTLVDRTGTIQATRTWDGGGADDRWTTAANWIGDATPLPGDDLVFAGSTRLNPDNDFGTDTAFASIGFATGAGAFTLASTLGRRLDLAGAVTNAGSATQTIALPMLMTATRTIDAASGDITVTGVLSGTGGLTKAGTGTLTLTTNNTFSGLLTVGAGTLAAAMGNSPTGAVGAASGVLIATGGTVSVLNDNAFVGVNTSGAKTIQIEAGGVLTCASGAASHLHAVVLNGGTLNSSGIAPVWGNWNLDYGISTLGGGTTSTISGGNVVLTQTGGTVFTIAAGDTVNVTSVIDHAPNPPDNGLIKAGAGTLTLAGANTYTSATTVNAGTLEAGVATQAFGIGSALTLADAAGATLDLAGFSNALGSLSGGGATGGNLALGAATLTTGGLNTSTTYAGVISGTGGITKTGSGTWTLAGTLANTQTGTTTITAGTLLLQKTAGVAALAGPVTIGDGTGSDVLRLGANNQIADIALITFTSGGPGNSAKLDLDGWVETVGGISTSVADQAPVIQDTETGAPTGPNSPAVLTIAASGDLAYDGIIRDGTGMLALIKTGSGALTLRCGYGAHDLIYTGPTTISAGRLVLDDLSAFNSSISVSSAAADALTFVQTTRAQTYGLGISGTGALTKSGPHALTLSGTVTATGATTVAGGTLLVTGSTAAGSAVTVAAGGTLGGTGTVGGTVSVVGGLAPGTGGTTIGTLASGAVTMDAAATLTVDLDGTTPSGDRLASAGAVVRAGTLNVASNSNAALGKVYTVLTSASASGTFTGLAPGALLSQAGRLYRIAYSANAVTLTDCAPALIARQTMDADGDGHLERIRLTFDEAVNDDFTGFTVTVAGYTVAGHGTGSTASDAAIDVLLTPLAGTDTGATPAVRITANTSLTQAAGTGLVPAEGSATAATDGAAPVLVSAAWTDGGAGGVSAGDTVTLTMSESVTVASMTVADLGLPVTGDTLASTTIADQAGATITMALLGTPRLSPGGLYSAAATAAGMASGVFIASGAHVLDAAGLAPVNGSAAGAVDLGPGTSTVAIAWASGSDPKTWALGTIALGGVANSITSGLDLTIRDVGDCTVDLAIASGAAAPSSWSPAASASSDAYLVKADASGAAASAPAVAASYPLTLAATPQALASGVPSGSSVSCALYFQAPTAITAGAGTQQVIAITVTAALAP
jgi:autotransporter-associated beta strand protein